MLRLAFRRLVLTLPTVLAAATLVFLLVHVVPGDPDASVMVIVKQADPGGLQVIIGEDATAEPLTDRAEILKKLEAAVKAGAKERKNTLLLKAEKQVALKDIVHVASAAAAVDGTQLRLAVLEKDK